MPLDVALIQRFLPPQSRGGAGHFTVGLAAALSARGHRVTIFSQDPGPAEAPYEIVQLPGGDRRLAPILFPRQVAGLDVGQFDIVHAQGDEQYLRHRGRPVLRTLHGSSLDEAAANGVRGLSPKHLALHAWFYAGELVAALRADAVTAVSAASGRHVPRHVDVIPNGVDTRALAPDGTPKSDAPSILFVGALDSRKRGRWLIDVFHADVRPRVPDAELWLVSPERADGPGIVWLGSLDDAALRDRYRRAWTLCLPSAYEGFGRPYVEALAAGTAVVASPNPGAREVLDDGRYGVIAEDAALGTAIAALLVDGERRAALARAGLARAADYDWDVVAARYERVYERVLKGRDRAAA